LHEVLLHELHFELFDEGLTVELLLFELNPKTENSRFTLLPRQLGQVASSTSLEEKHNSSKSVSHF